MAFPNWHGFGERRVVSVSQTRKVPGRLVVGTTLLALVLVDREKLGALIVWEFSAKDGSRIHIGEYPVRLR